MSVSWSSGGRELALLSNSFLLQRLKLSKVWRDLLGYYLSALEFASSAPGGMSALKYLNTAGREKGKVTRALDLEANATGLEPEVLRLVACRGTSGKSFHPSNYTYQVGWFRGSRDTTSTEADGKW